MRSHALVGAHVYLQAARGLRVRCRISDVKNQLCKIEAIEGEGSAWVRVKRLEPCYPDLLIESQEARRA